MAHRRRQNTTHVLVGGSRPSATLVAAALSTVLGLGCAIVRSFSAAGAWRRAGHPRMDATATPVHARDSIHLPPFQPTPVDPGKPRALTRPPITGRPVARPRHPRQPSRLEHRAHQGR